MSQPTQRHTNRLLGYPDDARLLIINADDFGMCHTANAAIARSLTDGVVRSTTLMVPLCVGPPRDAVAGRPRGFGASEAEAATSSIESSGDA